MLFISWKDDFNKKHWSQWEMFSFFLFMFSNKYISGCHIQISLAQLLGLGKSLILYRWVGQTVWADWAHSVSGPLSFQSSPILKKNTELPQSRGVPTPSYICQGRHLCVPLTPNQDSLQCKYSGISQSKLFLSHHATQKQWGCFCCCSLLFLNESIISI